ncbi:hypothetical protein [Streptomyces sp. NBC_00385]|uniref:hypothetical protein n=1 Tax=Streptomyces sp. NBC_00385 TaxID=2975733 RepID=UPI002DD92755|nr:hypothetical protein [Streptomyces sp. NBC_00385]WRZ03965.1 hypothetical protein OG959_11700 [Streptomyces sp. NBC_00385]
MGRPTEVPEALGTPTTSSNGDHRTGAAASGTLLADVSQPAWGPSTAPPDGAVDGPGDRTGPAPHPEPGPAPDPASAATPAPPAADDTPSAADDPTPPDAPAPHPAPRAPELAYTAPARKLSTGRRGPADPVKSLMYRHRELCERAVDPLEIAAGLEAHGVTDRTAARYRHRDVFSLAEELFARVPGVAGEPVGASFAPARDIETRAAWSLRALLPGAACLATFVALRLTEGVLDGGARLAIGSGGGLLAFVGLALALRTGPLCADGRSSGAAGLFGCWLLGYVLYGDALLHQLLSGGPEGPWDITPAPLLGLAVAVAPAAWCAHLFSVHAHRKLNGSRALEEFAAGVRPLLFAAVAFFLCALGGLLYLAGLGIGGGGSRSGAAALGVLLLLARLLTVHGFPEPAATGLAAACAVEVAAPALVLAGRLPGLDAVARPVEALIEAAGTGAVPAVACGAAALGLLTTATVALSRASAHTAA